LKQFTGDFIIMNPSSSIQFFDTQFQEQVRAADRQLNPFERDALPYLSGRVLDFGCGIGNLAVAAAQRGCSVVALDASPTAVRHLQAVARERELLIEAGEADLRNYELQEQFDAIVSIGLLMFFDCPAAFRQLDNIKTHVRPGGVAVINVLVEGTTYMDMFDPSGHCLFARDTLAQSFEGWQIERSMQQDFPAPREQVKSFVTVVARRLH
jgi:tellurite methyltransferase